MALLNSDKKILIFAIYNSIISTMASWLRAPNSISSNSSHKPSLSLACSSRPCTSKTPSITKQINCFVCFAIVKMKRPSVPMSYLSEVILTPWERWIVFLNQFNIVHLNILSGVWDETINYLFKIYRLWRYKKVVS